MHYPTELPTAAIRALLRKLSGAEVSLREAIRACWEIIGFGLGQAEAGGDGPAIFGSPGPETMSREECLDLLHRLMDNDPKAVAAAAETGPGMWLRIALALLQKILPELLDRA